MNSSSGSPVAKIRRKWSGESTWRQLRHRRAKVEQSTPERTEGLPAALAMGHFVFSIHPSSFHAASLAILCLTQSARLASYRPDSFICWWIDCDRWPRYIWRRLPCSITVWRSSYPAPDLRQW